MADSAAREAARKLRMERILKNSEKRINSVSNSVDPTSQLVPERSASEPVPTSSSGLEAVLTKVPVETDTSTSNEAIGNSQSQSQPQRAGFAQPSFFAPAPISSAPVSPTPTSSLSTASITPVPAPAPVAAQVAPTLESNIEAFLNQESSQLPGLVTADLSPPDEINSLFLSSPEMYPIRACYFFASLFSFLLVYIHALVYGWTEHFVEQTTSGRPYPHVVSELYLLNEIKYE